MLPSTKVKAFEGWGRFTLWISQHVPIVRLFGFAASLVAFLVFLPAYLRISFWDGLQSHKILASMLLVFSLLSISLIWSTGQKLDTRVFAIFHLRGPRPAWLDRIMVAFTQIGNGLTSVGITLFLFLAGDRMLAYELILGTITLWLAGELLKFLVHRSWPFIRVTQARIVGSRAKGRSFPSRYTSQSFFIATFVVQHFHARV